LALLNKEAHRDKRINLRMIGSNRGISEATNEAISMAQGEFVAFIDHDDEITRDALEEMVRAINIYPAADVLYSDQDYVNKDGSLYSKFYKPDWSPELFCGVMYVGHLLVVRRTLALDVGGCDPRFDFVQDFEFMLRLSEKTPNIVHVPKILYHWRRLQGSVALHGDAKPGIENLQAAAVNAHFRRRGFPALATSNPSHAHRLLTHPGPRKAFPTVTVLLDATETSSDLSRSIASILDRTVYSRFEIGLLNSAGAGGNRSFGPYRVVGETLSSALAQVDSEFIALVGSDIEILTPDWLSDLLLYAERSEIACVGPIILQPDGNVFSAGLVVTGASEICMAMQGSKPESDGYAGSLSCAREVTALGPTCIVVEAQKVRELKILDQFGFGPFQVIDLCMRAGQTGLRNICNPRARVKLMRAPVRQQKPRFDASLFQNLWQNEVEGRDRYHNPNFGNTDFGVPRRNRVLMASA
jgi:GT2 family glycosyltransferase